MGDRMAEHPRPLQHVFAACVVLRLLLGEGSANHIERRLDGSLMTAFTYHEVLTRLCDLGIGASDAQQMIDQLDIEVIPVDRQQIILGSSLWRATRNLALSFGDCACLALARLREATALTTDPIWGELDIAIRVEVVS